MSDNNLVANKTVRYYIVFNDKNIITGTERIDEQNLLSVPPSDIQEIPEGIYNHVSSELEKGNQFKVINGDIVFDGKSIEAFKRKVLRSSKAWLKAGLNNIYIENTLVHLTCEELSLLHLSNTHCMDFTTVRSDELLILKNPEIPKKIRSMLYRNEHIYSIYFMVINSLKTDDMNFIQKHLDMFKEFLINEDVFKET